MFSLFSKLFNGSENVEMKEVIQNENENEDVQETKETKEPLSFTVVGMKYHNFYIDDITNPDKKFSLVSEPENAFDPNAVAFYSDDKKIGYVARGQAPHVKEIIPNIQEIKIDSYTASSLGCSIHF